MKMTTETIEAKTGTWWHWFIEWCPNCKCNISQGPFRETIGEDCLLFERIERYKHEEPCLCPSCGTRAVALYRHAIADWNVLTDAHGNVTKAPLLPHQESGDFMAAIEYDLLKAEAKKGAK